MRQGEGTARRPRVLRAETGRRLRCPHFPSWGVQPRVGPLGDKKTLSICQPATNATTLSGAPREVTAGETQPDCTGDITQQ